MKKIYLILITILSFGSCTDIRKEQEKEAMKLQREALEMTLLDPSKSNRKVAKDLMNKAIETAPHMSSLYTIKAMFEIQDSTYSEAIKDIDKALEIDPEMAEYWVQKAQVEQALKDSVKAVVSFQKAIKCYDDRIKAGKDTDSNILEKWFIQTSIDQKTEENTKLLRQDLEQNTSLDKQQIESKIEVFGLMINK